MGNKQTQENVTVNNNNANNQLATFTITKDILLLFILSIICFYK